MFDLKSVPTAFVELTEAIVICHVAECPNNGVSVGLFYSGLVNCQECGEVITDITEGPSMDVPVTEAT